MVLKALKIGQEMSELWQKTQIDFNVAATY